jgi:hypothetical protein
MGDRSWVIPLKMPDSPPNGNRPNAVLRFNGSDALEIDFSGAESKGEPDVTLILIAALRKPGFVAICYWGDDEALESVSNDIQAIADSVELVK